MTKPAEPPTVEHTSRAGDDDVTIEHHPAFGQIGAARANGSTNLYGSDFKHHAFMVIRVLHSELHRELSSDWPFARNEIIEVALSESQWATFVSSPNVGDGVQCTILRHAGEAIPRIAMKHDRRAQFTGELKKRLEKAEAGLAALQSDIETGRPGKKALLDSIHQIQMNLTPNLAYVAERFSKHVERTVDAARAEIGAYIGRALSRAGLHPADQQPVIELPQQAEGSKERTEKKD